MNSQTNQETRFAIAVEIASSTDGDSELKTKVLEAMAEQDPAIKALKFYRAKPEKLGKIPAAAKAAYKKLGGA